MQVLRASKYAALETPQLLPSASFCLRNFTRLIIAVNHCRLPAVLFIYIYIFYPAASLCPCPPPPTLLRARLATARHNESSCTWETAWGGEWGFKGRWWARCRLCRGRLFGSNSMGCSLELDKTNVSAMKAEVWFRHLFVFLSCPGLSHWFTHMRIHRCFSSSLLKL